MCNRYEQHLAWEEYSALMQTIELEMPSWQTEIEWKVADEIGIGERGSVLCWNGSGVDLALMQFGRNDQGRKPVFNFVSEGRDFSKSFRCIIPATGFFEYTGTKSPKAMHRFSLPDVAAMGIAGVWWHIDGNHPDAFAMLTTSPGADIQPYHNRQIVLLKPDQWRAWLRYDPDITEALAPSPAGTLEHRLVRHGKDSFVAEDPQANLL